MKKIITMLVFTLITVRIAAQSPSHMRIVSTKKAIDYYVKSHYGKADSGKTLVFIGIYSTLVDTTQLKPFINIITVPNMDSACVIFKGNVEKTTMEDFIELDFDMDRRETIWSARISVFRLDLNCNGIDPLWKEKREKRKKEGSYSVFSFNHKLTEITYERHR